MFDLYLITPERSAADIVACVGAALRTNVRARVALQLRANHLTTRELFELARELRELTKRVDALLFVNDRVDIALDCDADGVQLPEKGLPIAAARALVGVRMQLATSCHDLAGLERAADGGASFATLAPVFEVPGKNPALGIDTFRTITAAARIAVVALGGIGKPHIPALCAAGASGIAMIREVFDAHDPAARLTDCLAAVAAAKITR